VVSQCLHALSRGQYDGQYDGQCDGQYDGYYDGQSVSVYTLCHGAANIDIVVDVPAVLTTVVNLVYVMSWVFLQRQFISIRVQLLSLWQLVTLENSLFVYVVNADFVVKKIIIV